MKSLEEKFPYKTTFASIPKIIYPQEDSKGLALASLNSLKDLVPSNIDFESNCDVIFNSFNAAVANRVNKNGDSIDNTTALNIYKNFIYKFCDLEHKRDLIVGSIINSGFSTFGTNELITEEDVKNTSEPVNICLAAVVWRVLNEKFADLLVNASDETSILQNSVSASWELGFADYQILLGSKNLSEAELITDAKQIKEFSKLLKINNGSGMTKDKVPVYRKIIGEMYPLGIGYVKNPAADVHGVIVVDENSVEESNASNKEVIEIESSKAKDSESKENKTLNKPFRTPGGPKKFSVYVKNDKGNIVKVNFGDPNMEIKRDSPERKKSFRARHGCDKNPGPKWKAKYWSCKMWSSTPVSSLAFFIDEAKQKGLWENIEEKKKRMGDDYKPAKPGDEDYPEKEGFERAQAEEWDGKMFLEEADILKENPSLALITEEINEEDEDECECEDCKGKQEILAKNKENIKNIATENKKCVNKNTNLSIINKNIKKSMKLKFNDITKDSLESVANTDLYELAKDLNEQSTKFAVERDAKAAEADLAKKEVADVKAKNEALAADLEKVKVELNKLEEARAKEKIQNDFNVRMSDLKEKYTLDAAQARSIAKQIRGLDDETFASWLEDHSAFLVAKETPDFIKEKMDSKKEDEKSKEDDKEDEKECKAKKECKASLIDEIKALKPETKPIENKITVNKTTQEIWAEAFAGLAEVNDVVTEK